MLISFVLQIKNSKEILVQQIHIFYSCGLIQVKLSLLIYQDYIAVFYFEREDKAKWIYQWNHKSIEPQ